VGPRRNSTTIEPGGKKGLSRVNDEDSRGLEVPLRAFWRKAKGGGGRLRQATAREEKKRERRTEGEREEEKKREKKQEEKIKE
jgi:hypothetical protein